MTKTTVPETKQELQSRLAAIEAEELRIESIHNDRTRLRDAVANAERRLAAGTAMVQKLRESANAQWNALVTNRLPTLEEIVSPSLQVGDIDGHVLEVIGTEFERAQYSDFILSSADGKWIKPLENALAEAKAALADFEKSNPSK